MNFHWPCYCSSQLNMNFHWPCYCNVHIFVVIHFCDSVWSFWLEADILLFTYITIGFWFQLLRGCGLTDLPGHIFCGYPSHRVSESSYLTDYYNNRVSESSYLTDYYNNRVSERSYLTDYYNNRVSERS
jgi:hypothetical protein